jgi:predicted DsbA family dithiol-disulfide isomerase
MDNRQVRPDFQGTQNIKPSSTDRVVVTYYTDPLCCWSWALEPHWNKLKTEFRNLITWNYVMGGMIQDWRTYNDPMNSVSKPLQMGPVWMHASQFSATPIDYGIWHNDPPASSFPSCIAVKCAAVQSEASQELLLNALREAVMTRGLNIAKESIIFKVAAELAEKEADFDFDRFTSSWADGSGVDAFRNDLQKTRFLKIGRYPTLTFTNNNTTGIMITGYRPYEVLVDALSQITDVSKAVAE